MTDTDDIVRDGDRVAGQSLVLALPGRPVQFCGPPMGTGRTAPDLPAGPQRVPEPCPNALTVTGIHLDRLTHRKAVGDAIWGWAGVEGIELNGPYVTYPYG